MLRRSLFAALLLTASPVAASAADVVVSIRPLHSLVASIMQGAGEPTLLMKGNVDPHNAQLTPSMARSISEAKLVIWAGPDMSTGLIKPIESLAQGTTVVNLGEEEDGHDDHAGHDHGGEAKEAAAKDDHDHDHDHSKEAKADDHDHDHDHSKEAKADDHDHDHDHSKEAKADDHDHDHDHSKEAKADDHDHDDHDHAKEASAEGHDDHDDHAGHAHEGDPHTWLDPHAMEEAVADIVAELSKIDPDNAATFEANGKALAAKLEAIDEEMRATTTALRESKQPIYQIHDAATHFMERYGLVKGMTLLGANTEGGSAKAMSDMREALAAAPGCLLVEPTTKASQIATLTEGRSTKVVTFDPLGREIPEGVGQYEALLASLGAALEGCAESS
ncbi:MAG: metal ABC transporter substrate-binding protein [Pseudomonadota bacterium]